MGQIITMLLIIGVVIFILAKIRSKFKFPVIPCMSITTGAIKSGKSTFTLAYAIKLYKRNLRRVKRRNFIRRIIGKEQEEEPKLYSNIPLKIPYVQLTEDLLLRKKRFNFKSVIYVNEASLIANSQDFKNELINEQLLLFNKLIGHELKGGYILYDTQCIADCHYNIKRCVSNYFYIHHTTKWIPFFLVVYLMEQRYSYDGSIIATEQDDIEGRLKRVIIPKSIWKKFDAFCYSEQTDGLIKEDTEIKTNKLKCKNIVSFIKFKTINEEKPKVFEEIKRSKENESKI